MTEYVQRSPENEDTKQAKQTIEELVESRLLEIDTELNKLERILKTASSTWVANTLGKMTIPDYKRSFSWQKAILSEEARRLKEAIQIIRGLR